jgi:hypothetical protein
LKLANANQTHSIPSHFFAWCTFWYWWTVLGLGPNWRKGSIPRIIFCFSTYNRSTCGWDRDLVEWWTRYVVLLYSDAVINMAQAVAHSRGFSKRMVDSSGRADNTPRRLILTLGSSKPKFSTWMKI